MTRMIFRLVLIVAFAAAAWSVGRAQAKVADFELSVRVANGKVTLTCGRGCDWAGATPNTLAIDCAGSAPCNGTVTGHGLVTGMQIR